MKNKLYISLFAAAAMGFAACESDIDNFMVDDTVGFLNPGLVDVEVYKGDDTATKVFVIKAGKGFNSAEATATVDPAVVTRYNTEHASDRGFVPVAALPADCYTLTVSHVTLTNNDYRMPFEITWHRDKLEAALAADPNLVVALDLSVVTDGVVADGGKHNGIVYENRLYTLIRPRVATPLVAFAKPGLMIGTMPTRRDAAVNEFYFDIAANFIAQRDIEYTLEIDPTLVDDYNAANGTSYRVLPAEAYELETEGVIKKYLKSCKFMLRFFRTALVPDNAPSQFGDYILPIRLKSLSSSEIDPTKDALLYAVSVVPTEIEKTGWSVLDCNSSVLDDPGMKPEIDGERGPEALFDGTTNRWWRSVYTVVQELPYYVSIDLGRKVAVSAFSFDIPSSTDKKYANAKEGRVFVSNDGVNWGEPAALWVSPSKATATVKFDVNAPQAVRYIRFQIDKHYSKPSGCTNTYAQGIGEVHVFGEEATWEDDAVTPAE